MALTKVLSMLLGSPLLLVQAQTVIGPTVGAIDGEYSNVSINDGDCDGVSIAVARNGQPFVNGC